jgi:hypothetical protein
LVHERTKEGEVIKGDVETLLSRVVIMCGLGVLSVLSLGVNIVVQALEVVLRNKGRHLLLLGDALLAPQKVEMARLILFVECIQPNLVGGGLGAVLSLSGVHLLQSALVILVKLGGDLCVALVPNPGIIVGKLSEGFSGERHEVGGEHGDLREFAANLRLVVLLPVRKVQQEDLNGALLFGGDLGGGHVTKNN